MEIDVTKIKSIKINGDFYILENIIQVSKISEYDKNRTQFYVFFNTGASLLFVKGISEEDTGTTSYDKNIQIRVFSSLEEIRNKILDIIGLVV